MAALVETEDLRLSQIQAFPPAGKPEKRHRPDLAEEQGLMGIYTNTHNHLLMFRGLAEAPDLEEAPGVSIE